MVILIHVLDSILDDNMFNKQYYNPDYTAASATDPRSCSCKQFEVTEQ